MFTALYFYPDCIKNKERGKKTLPKIKFLSI